MPYRPLSRCTICGQKHKGRCSKDVQRKLDPFYWTALWRRIRARQLGTEPLCRICQENEILEPATDVDHIRPISHGGHRTDPDNLQSLCKSCHSRKTINETLHNRPQ